MHDTIHQLFYMQQNTLSNRVAHIIAHVRIKQHFGIKLVQATQHFKDQIASYRETLSDSEQADLLVDFTLEPKQALKRVIKDGKKVGYVFDRDELAEELEEMNKGGSFSDIELDAAAMEAMFSQGGEQEWGRANSGC